MFSSTCQELGGHWWGWCPALTTDSLAQGAWPHPPATAGHSPPSMGTTAGETQGWRDALPEGWKIAVGSIPSQGAFIIHSSLDDRGKVRADLKQN